MPPEAREMARLWDMLDAARTAVAFTQELDYETFLNDRKTRNAVERNLEIVGEAARALSQATRDANPDIPWRSIIALSNIIRPRIWGNPLREPLDCLRQEASAADHTVGGAGRGKSTAGGITV